MRLKRIPLFFFLVMLRALLLSKNSLAENLTLSEAVQETSRNSLQIQKAESVFAEYQWKKKEAYSGFLPSLSGSLNYLLDKKYMLLDTTVGGGPITIPQVVPTTQYTLRASWSLFDGFSSSNRFRASQFLEDSAKSELEWTQFSTTRQTILLFYKSLASKTLQDVAEQNLKTLQDHLKDIYAFKKAGVSTTYEVLRVEVQVSEAQAEFLNSQDNAELSKYKLGEVLGKELETRNLSGQLPALSEELLKKINDKILEQRKDILALRQKTDAAHWNHQAMNRYWVPKISLFGETQYYNNRNDRFSDKDAFRDGYLVGVSLVWNIFDGMSSIARSEQSDQQEIQTQKILRMAEIKARQDFEFWKRKYKYFCSVYKSRLNDAARSQEAVRLAKEGRRAGVRTSSELLDAESDLFRSRAGQVNAQIGAIEALINLELVSGQKLYEFTN